MLYVICNKVKVGVCGDPTALWKGVEIDVGYILLDGPSISQAKELPVESPHDIPVFDLFTENGDAAYDQCGITRWGSHFLVGGDRKSIVIENASLSFLRHRS